MYFKNQKFNKVLNRETILYIIVGIGTSLLNIAAFQFLLFANIGYRSANFITLVIVKLTAYVLNKNLVFCCHTKNLIELILEFFRFLVARGATMLIDYFGVILMVEFFHAPKLISKCLFTIIVIIINYFTGKKHVFRSNS